MKKILLLLILFSVSVIAQSIRISGSVYNSETREPIPYVNIRLAESTRGTSSNADGRFVFSTSMNNPTLIFTAVGYKRKEIKLHEASVNNLEVSLIPEPVQLSEIIVNSDEDPAYSIIREAIKRKYENRAGLKSLEYNFFAKDIFLSAGDVVMVSEQFATGYFQLNKYEKIITNSVHITENEKKNALKFDQNILSKIYIDFTDDTLKIVGNTVFLPLAKNAFDWYDYRLREVKISDPGYDYYIEVRPRSKIQPLVRGKIVIEDSTYALKGLELTSSEGLRFPFVNDLNVEFFQNRNRYNKYWLPSYQKVDASMKLNVANLLSTDEIAMKQTILFSDYTINPSIPDSIYHVYSTTQNDSSKNPEIKFVKAKLLDRLEIDSLRLIPLTIAEENAYKSLDSSKTVVTQIKYKGLLGGVVTEAVNREQNESSGNNSSILKYFGKSISYLRFRNNRVNGITIGAHYDQSIIKNKLNFDVGLSYAFGRKALEGYFTSFYKIEKGIFNSVQFSLFDEAKQTQLLNPYPDFINGINVLLGFNDHLNYLHSSGVSLGLISKPLKKLTISTSVIFEKQQSLPGLKYQSLFNTGRIVRINPQINEGMDNRISLNVQLGTDPYKFSPVIMDGLIAQFELSNPILNSVFNYKRLQIQAQVTTSTIYNELFSAPYFLFGLETGITFGNFGPQHLITPTTALNIYSPFLSMKGIETYEYIGDKLIALHVEHNWRTIPFQLMGIDFLTDLNFDVITGINFLKVWNDSPYFTSQIPNPDYWEGYISLGKLFGLGRIDFSYGANKKFVVRVGLSTVL
ncbi:MAG: carboxypeptidase-like regulatory domain-containing protein [Ignavibacteria bacterium]|nr:carboxypeptidase-like regulatory domain-containing protein [Ignavibacteria bacterium]